MNKCIELLMQVMEGQPYLSTNFVCDNSILCMDVVCMRVCLFVFPMLSFDFLCCVYLSMFLHICYLWKNWKLGNAKSACNKIINEKMYWPPRASHGRPALSEYDLRVIVVSYLYIVVEVFWIYLISSYYILYFLMSPQFT